MDSSPSTPKPTLLERLSTLLLREPEDREQLLALLHSAFERDLLDADALTIIEGAMAASETSVRDVMVPRAQMDVIDVDAPLEKLIPTVIEAAHSRLDVLNEFVATTVSEANAPDCAKAPNAPTSAQRAAAATHAPRCGSRFASSDLS